MENRDAAGAIALFIPFLQSSAAGTPLRHLRRMPTWRSWRAMGSSMEQLPPARTNRSLRRPDADVKIGVEWTDDQLGPRYACNSLQPSYDAPMDVEAR